VRIQRIMQAHLKGASARSGWRQRIDNLQGADRQGVGASRGTVLPTDSDGVMKALRQTLWWRMAPLGGQENVSA